MSVDLSNYVPVTERISEFYASCPHGRIEASIPQVVQIGERYFISVTATVYRDSDPESLPAGVGSAWEPFPGQSNFTRDSEAMNAETSAVGRALANAGVAVNRSVASREDVMRRQQEQEPISPQDQAELQQTIAGMDERHQAMLREEWKRHRIRKLEHLTVAELGRVHDLIVDVEGRPFDAEQGALV